MKYSYEMERELEELKKRIANTKDFEQRRELRKQYRKLYAEYIETLKREIKDFLEV